jgi:hypothetical protein
MMNAASTSFRGEEAGALAGRERAALARLVALAPRVFPAVAVGAEWEAALDQAREVLKPRKKGSGR